MRNSFSSSENGRTSEDQQKGDVQQQGRRALRPALAQQEREAGNGRHRPQDEENGIVINDPQGRVGVVEAFHERGGHHHRDDDRHGAVAQDLECLRLHR